MADDDRVDLSLEDALSALEVIPDYGGLGPHVHCFMPAGSALLGAHWPLEDVRQLFEKVGAEVSGEGAQAWQHGVAVRKVVYEGGRDDAGPAFFATRKDWVPPTEPSR